MRATKNPDKALDRAIERAWYDHSPGWQIQILDIPKVFRDAKLEVSGGMDVEQAVIQARNKYAKPPQ